MKILLAIDNSKFSEAATQTLIKQVRPNGNEVRVLHVIELYPLFSPGEQPRPELAVASEEHRHNAEALAARTAKALRDAGFGQVTTSVEAGDPRFIVLDRSAEWKADLIIMGSHGQKGLQRFSLGSVSEAIARHAPCSVQIVRIPNA